MKHVMFVFLLALAAVPASAGSETASIDEGVTDIAKDILPGVRKLSGKICVLDFIPLVDMAKADPGFGRLVSEKLSTELVRKHRKKDPYTVVDRLQLVRIMDDADLWGDKPETYDKLRQKAGMDYLVSGTYGILETEVALTAKVIRTEDGQVVASGKTALKLTPGLERLLGRAPKPGRNKEKIAMEAAVVYKGDDGRLRILREGMTLRSDNLYGVYLRPAQDSHVYIYQADSTGTVVRLFPNEEFSTGGNFLRAGEERWVPNDTELFRLDEIRGIETVYVVASHDPISELHELVAAQRPQLQEKFKTVGLMGVKGTERDQAQRVRPFKGKPVDIKALQFAAEGGFFYTVSFDHQ